MLLTGPPWIGLLRMALRLARFLHVNASCYSSLLRLTEALLGSLCHFMVVMCTGAGTS